MPPKYLIIVESPGKIKKIQSFLDSNYIVAASVGHIRDLVSSRENRLGIDVSNEFKPFFEIDPKKADIVKRLKSLKSGKTVILAADGDREGEAIAESLRDVLNLGTKYQRIRFNEITKKSILDALSNPTQIDQSLVEAQLTRRILDRLVGFELSPLLAKMPELVSSGHYSLGIGRVQSAVLRLIVEIEKEIESFTGETLFTGTGKFIFKGEAHPPRIPQSAPALGFPLVQTSYNREDRELTQLIETQLLDSQKKLVKISDQKTAEKVLKEVLGSNWTIVKTDIKKSHTSPGAPFTTSTLQQDASSILGFSVKKTMNVAQQLYEEGLITYMRTDSTLMSETAMNSCRELICQQYGEKNYQHHQYQTKSKSAQEAHEAIRPTNFSINQNSISSDSSSTSLEISDDMKRLYRLIWNKTVASQMKPAEYVVISVLLNDNNPDTNRYMKGEIKLLHTPGYQVVSKRDISPEIDTETISLYKQMAKEEKFYTQFISADMTQQLTQPPSRYSEASLVKQLERLGIGRPSTYVGIISKVQEHDYIRVSDYPGEKVQLICLMGEVEITGHPDGSTKVLSIGLEEGQTKHGQRWIVYPPKFIESFRGKSSKRLAPTELGVTVAKFMIDYFNPIVDYNFTSQIESKLDLIADKETTRVQVLTGFYQTFRDLVSTYISSKPALIKEKESSLIKKWTELFLISDEDNNKTYKVSIGKTKKGPALRLIESNLTEIESRKLKKTIFLDWNQPKPPIEKEVIALLKPKSDPVFDTCQVKRGPHGPYLKLESGKCISIPKDINPEKITKEQTNELIDGSNKSIIKVIGDYVISNGPYGPYIRIPAKRKGGKPKFIKIPPNIKPRELDIAREGDLPLDPPLKGWESSQPALTLKKE